MRPTARNTSSGNHYEERSSRPARQRLSRDAVDRAWENGATRKYADYRPRQNASTPPTQRQGRPSPAFNRSQPPYERRAYGDRREGNGASSSSFSRGEYTPQRERRPEAGPRRFNTPGYRAPGNQPGLNSERWTRNSAPQRGGYREHYQDDRPERFNQHASGGPQRPHYRAEEHSRPFERSERERENFARGKRPGAPRPRRDTYNPRWQSRPGPQREYQNYQESRREYSQAPHRPHSRPGEAQFEGDYERFDSYEYNERPAQNFEKQVTPLPDGRVLKGSRPWQRKQARFWTEVEEETSSLLPSAQPRQDLPEPVAPSPRQKTPDAKPARPRKQPAAQTGKVKTVRTARASKPGASHSKARAGKKGDGPPAAPGSVTRPSQRGYKWPTAGA